MACMSALCRRLKMIFSWDRWVTRRRRREVRFAPDGGSLTVSVNPFASIQGESLTRVRPRRDDGPKDKRSSIRKVLNFASCSGESSPPPPPSTAAVVAEGTVATEVGRSVTRSLEPLAPGSCSSLGRYGREFVELELVGSGQFGSVYRCLHRLDGVSYAVKRSKPLTRNAYAHRRSCNEVHANAVLGNHPRIVRYFSAWMEGERMYIQQEYCDAGDLAALVAGTGRAELPLQEPELRRIIRHVAEGLGYIHRMRLAHMDIKPDNIFVCRSRVWKSREAGLESSAGAGAGDESSSFEEEVVYKIGDLGHVTSTIDTKELEDEGDCRYLSKEILREDYRDLTKADIFSLGLTIYEAAGGGPLPKNGPAWHDIRNGNLKAIAQLRSHGFNELLKMMIHPEPEKRPSAAKLVKLEASLDQSRSAEGK